MRVLADIDESVIEELRHQVTVLEETLAQRTGERDEARQTIKALLDLLQPADRVVPVLAELAQAAQTFGEIRCRVCGATFTKKRKHQLVCPTCTTESHRTAALARVARARQTGVVAGKFVGT